MAKQIAPTEMKKIGSGLYLAPGIVTQNGEPVFLYVRDKRKEIKKDYGWVVAVGENLTELSEACHDRRTKALDELNLRLRKREFTDGDPVIEGKTFTGYGGFSVTVAVGGMKTSTPTHQATPANSNGAAPAPRARGYKPPQLTGKETVAQLTEIYNKEAENLGYTPIEKHKGTKQELINKIQTMQPKKGRKAA